MCPESQVRIRRVLRGGVDDAARGEDDDPRCRRDRAIRSVHEWWTMAAKGRPVVTPELRVAKEWAGTGADLQYRLRPVRSLHSRPERVRMRIAEQHNGRIMRVIVAHAIDVTPVFRWLPVPCQATVIAAQLGWPGEWIDGKWRALR